MSASLSRIRSSGTTVFLHRCEVCGADAQFGEAVDLRKAYLALDSGDKETAKRLLGRWYCGQHRPGSGAS